MTVHPQRFLHAANLRLGVPVSVWQTEQLDPELQTELEDATISAFDQIVQHCILQEAGFLLLSGNAFIESDRSLRARLSLLTGFRELQRNGIAVFVLPGETDPPEAWRAIPDLPDNVTVCYSSGLHPAELIQEGQITATISPAMWLGETDEFGIRVIPASTDELNPFRVGVISRSRFEEAQRMAAESAQAEERLLTSESATVTASRPSDQNDFSHITGDTSQPSEFLRFAEELLREGRLHYLALTGEQSRITAEVAGGVLHCPGTSQPRNWNDNSIGLCSLVEVQDDGSVEITELDTAAVSWRTCEMTPDRSTDLSSLLMQMRDTLLDTGFSSSEQVVAVNWTIRGDLPQLQALQQNDLDSALATELGEIQVDDGTIRLLHCVRCLPHDWPEQPASSPLAAQYQQHFRFPALFENSELSRLITGSADLNDSWKTRLLSILSASDSEQIVAHVRTQGAAWFSPVLELNEDDMTKADEDLQVHLETAAAGTAGSTDNSLQKQHQLDREVAAVVQDSFAESDSTEMHEHNPVQEPHNSRTADDEERDDEDELEYDEDAEEDESAEYDEEAEEYDEEEPDDDYEDEDDDDAEDDSYDEDEEDEEDEE